MSARFTFSSLLASLLASATVTIAAPRAAHAEAMVDDVRPLVVVVRGDGAEVDAPAIRSAIAAELHVEALAADDARARSARGTITVAWNRATFELAVSVDETGRGSVSRVVVLPTATTGKPEITSSAALLAGNLARHEADELAGPVVVPVAAPASPPPAPPSKPAAPTTFAALTTPFRVATVGAFFPAATNFDDPEARTHLDCNLLYGRLGELDGVQLGTVNQVSHDVRGLQIGLAANVVGGNMQGLQIGGGGNVVTGAGRGLQIGGAFSSLGGAGAPEDGKGLQMPGGFKGLQIGGAASVASSGFAGIQIAGAVSVAGASLEGLQIAGATAVTKGAVTGVQTAGGMAIAGDVTGLQIAAINIGKRVKGLQIGIINVADDVDGLALGLASVTKTGGVHPVAWSSNNAFANAGIKFATRHTYTIVSGAYHQETGRNLGGPAFTVGGHIPLAPFYVEVDVQGLHLFSEVPSGSSMLRPRAGDQTQLKGRGTVGFSILKHLSVFVGGGVTSVLHYPQGRSVDVEVKPEVFAGVQL